MKKALSLLLSILMIMTAFSGAFPASAENMVFGDYEYKSSEDGLIITAYNGNEESVVIPAQLDGKAVYEISSSAFNGKDGIKEIYISDGIAEIGSDAFANIPTLEKITFTRNIDSFPPYCLSNSGNELQIIIVNPDCDINNIYGVNENITLLAEENSKAQKFAKKKNINFIAADTHYYVTEKVVTPATFENEGEVDFICNKCGAVAYSQSVPKIGEVTISNTSYVYTGSDNKPNVTVLDINKKKINKMYYTVKYDSNNTDAGTHKVKITFKSRYSGSISKSYKVKSIAIKKSDIKIKSVGYTGKATYPNITYKGKKLKKDKDFTVSKISKNKNFGTASFKIKLKGNFSGTISGSYKIIPAKVSDLSLVSRDKSSITVKWKKTKGATGYKIYRLKENEGKYKLYKTTSSTTAKINRCDKYSETVDIYIVAYKKSGKTTYTSSKLYYNDCVKPKKASYSVKCTDKGKIKIPFNNIDAFEGVRVNIQICTNKSFDKKKYEVVNLYAEVDRFDNDKSIYVYDIPGKTDYYVRCRYFNYNASDKPVYGAWGEIKSVYVK